MISFLLAPAAMAGDPSAMPVARAASLGKWKLPDTRNHRTRMDASSVCQTADERRLQKEEAERMLNDRRDTFGAAPSRPAGLSN